MSELDELDTFNRWMVGLHMDDIVIMRPPNRLTPIEALLFAAWLVSLAEYQAVETKCEHEFRVYSIDNAKSPADEPELVQWVKCIKCGRRPENGKGSHNG